MNHSVFESESCRVEYRAADGVVFLAWKKFCCLEDYRKPTSFALKLLQKHPGSLFVIDARNGFEDDPADVEWGFSFLLPEMAKTGCRGVAFLLAEASTIEAEMDMWTREFLRYFPVKKARSYAEAVKQFEGITGPK